MTPKNLLIFMSDEHSAKVLGCYGNSIVRTPHIDSMAAQGTKFTSAYCCSPICVPSRASFATGKYNHQIGYWDNADPYDGSISSWHHQIREREHQVVSIGKLHFRSTDDDNGFSEEIIPMHVRDGLGDLEGLVRENMPEFQGLRVMSEMAGPGESDYIQYDREIAAKAQTWIKEEAPKHTDKPWVLYVSFLAPHFPLTVPEQYFNYYYQHEDLPMPKLYDQRERPQHPFLKDYANSVAYDKYFTSNDQVRRAVAGYYGLCNFLDDQIGKVIQALDESVLAPDTRIMYTSDHGDNLGSRGLWGKSTMYEESSAVPLIISGSGIPPGYTCDEPVSHVDAYPFILECLGEDSDTTITPDHYGVSLAELAKGTRPDRIVLSEYHAMGSTAAVFMVRLRNYKYIYYAGRYPDQLFDLEKDPGELVDLSDDPAYRELIVEARKRLYTMVDPEAVDARAKKRQKELLESAGGRDAVLGSEELAFTPPPGLN